MINWEKLPILNKNHEWLDDNPDYLELYERLGMDNTEDYIIVYSNIHEIKDVANELINNNIEFSHHSCHLSDESYLLIDECQE
tara:strand:- start:1468 stop:1716 length:249 start_codon:yes stop_codon:yes gene_type:complete